MGTRLSVLSTFDTNSPTGVRNIDLLFLNLCKSRFLFITNSEFRVRILMLKIGVLMQNCSKPMKLSTDGEGAMEMGWLGEGDCAFRIAGK